jgi:hypothetical protein
MAGMSWRTHSASIIRLGLGSRMRAAAASIPPSCSTCIVAGRSRVRIIRLGVPGNVVQRLNRLALCRLPPPTAPAAAHSCSSPAPPAPRRGNAEPKTDLLGLPIGAKAVNASHVPWSGWDGPHRPVPPSRKANDTSARRTEPWATAAVGAKIAFPDRVVVSMVGDGGFMMTSQEIATAFHHGVAPIVLVFNNQMYGSIRMHQERAYPWRVSGTALTNPDFCKYIEAFGGHGEIVTATEKFTPAFNRAVEPGKPALIELRTNPDQITSRSTIADLRAGRKPPKAPAKPKRATAPARAKNAAERSPACAGLRRGRMKILQR